MTTLSPLELLFEAENPSNLLLPPDLATLYGRFLLPAQLDRPYVISNFVTTLDGVTALNDPRHPAGSDISGGNTHDRAVMGLLRALADAVIVGAGTFRSVPNHRWTAEYIYPPLSSAYAELRTAMGKTKPPLNVIVSAHGNLDLNRPLFQSGSIPVLIVTTPSGAQHLATQELPPTVQLSTIAHADTITAKDVLQAIQRVQHVQYILVEGGPQLMGDFFAEQLLDELFLTLAPQVAGRNNASERPGLVSGKLFAPDHSLWSRLISIRRVDSYLFLRYAFTPHNVGIQ